MKKIKLICIIAFSAIATIYIGCTKSTTTTSSPLTLTVTVSPALDTIRSGSGKGACEQMELFLGSGGVIFHLKNGSKFTTDPINVTKGQNLPYRFIWSTIVSYQCHSFNVEANYNGKIIDTRTLSMGVQIVSAGNTCADGKDKSVNLIIP